MTKARDLANASTALSAVSSAELAFLDGVTSAVQTQIDSKIGQATAINPTIVDAKGDLIAGTGADAVARLAVGTNGQVLTADSAEATGLKFATPAGGSANFTLLNTGGTSLSGTSTSITGISGQDKLLVLIKGASHTSAFDYLLQVQFNTNTGSVYSFQGLSIQGSTSYAPSIIGQQNQTTTAINICSTSAVATSTASGFVLITGCNSSGVKPFTAAGGASATTATDQFVRSGGGVFDSSATISSVQIKFEGGTFDAGTVFIYGSA